MQKDGMWVALARGSTTTPLSYWKSANDWLKKGTFNRQGAAAHQPVGYFETFTWIASIPSSTNSLTFSLYIYKTPSSLLHDLTWPDSILFEILSFSQSPSSWWRTRTFSAPPRPRLHGTTSSSGCATPPPPSSSNPSRGLAPFASQFPISKLEIPVNSKFSISRSCSAVDDPNRPSRDRAAITVRSSALWSKGRFSSIWRLWSFAVGWPPDGRSGPAESFARSAAEGISGSNWNGTVFLVNLQFYRVVLEPCTWSGQGQRCGAGVPRQHGEGLSRAFALGRLLGGRAR